MGNVVKYGAVSTKIRALEGQLLSGDDYQRLLQCKSVGEVVHYLKNNTHYKAVLNGVEENSIHRRELEILLRKHMLDTLKRLTYYFNGAGKEFVRVLFMKHEIEDLKILIRATYTDRNYMNSRDSLIYIGRYSNVDYNRIASSRNFDELIAALENTPYYRYLKPLIGRISENEQFKIEMALDLAFFKLLESSIKGLSKAEQKTIGEIQGKRADLFNIQWIARGFRFYRLSPEVLFNYTIDFGYYFKYRDIKRLCYCESTGEFEEEIAKTPYRFLFGHGDESDYIFMERRMYRYQYYMLLGYKKRGGMDITQTLIYFRFFEYEIRDIISILENIRYGIYDINEAKKYLIKEF